MTESAVIRAHIEALRRYARVLTRGEDEADDLVQAVLLRAHEKRFLFREGGDMRVWLMAILHNLFLDTVRSRTASRRREQDWAGLNPGFVAPEGEQAIRLTQLRQAFLALPVEQRQALHLVVVEGMSVAETASVLGLPEGTVMSRVGRARAALRNFEDGIVRSASHTLKIVRGHDED